MKLVPLESSLTYPLIGEFPAHSSASSQVSTIETFLPGVFPQLCSISTLLVMLYISLFCVCSDMFVWFWISSHKTPILFPYPCPPATHLSPVETSVFYRGYFFPSRDTSCKQANRSMYAFHPTPFTWIVAYYDYCSASSFFLLNILGDVQC